MGIILWALRQSSSRRNVGVGPWVTATMWARSDRPGFWARWRRWVSVCGLMPDAVASWMARTLSPSVCCRKSPVYEVGRGTTTG
eukprot:6412490-Lingulodinium_polyedra.AAC.1